MYQVRLLTSFTQLTSVMTILFVRLDVIRSVNMSSVTTHSLILFTPECQLRLCQHRMQRLATGLPYCGGTDFSAS